MSDIKLPVWLGSGKSSLWVVDYPLLMSSHSRESVREISTNSFVGELISFMSVPPS